MSTNILALRNMYVMYSYRLIVNCFLLQSLSLLGLRLLSYGMISMIELVSVAALDR